MHIKSLFQKAKYLKKRFKYLYNVFSSEGKILRTASTNTSTEGFPARIVRNSLFCIRKANLDNICRCTLDELDSMAKKTKTGFASGDIMARAFLG